jgi:hypothetical protein
MKMNTRYLLILLLIIVLPFKRNKACTTPVFLYAMQMWQQDAYQGLVIYRNALTAEEEKILYTFQGSISDSMLLNLSIQKMEISSDRKALKRILGREIPKELPAFVLWHGGRMGLDPPFWESTLKEAAMAGITDSPVRSEIANHLVRGVPIVWVFVRSGNDDRDNRAAVILKDQMDEAKAEILQDPVFQPHFRHIIDKKNLFPIVEVSRGSDREQVLLPMLLAYYPGLKELDEPLLFPVFGRGRAVGVLKGDEIEALNLEDVIAFLLNPCSCQIKVANPGFDLMLKGDWYTLLARYEEAPVRPVMASVLPDTIIRYEFEDVPDMTGVSTGFFRTKILSAAGIIVGVILAMIVLASVIIIKRR